MAYVERKWRSSDDLMLFARDYAPAAGEARLPVIAIHGLTRNSADFEAIAPVIAATGRRVLAVDVRGRGRADRAADPMTDVPPVYAADVLALMSASGIERAVFLGTSMGGLITMTLMAIKPDAVAAAMINDIGPEVSPEGLARIAAYTGKGATVRTWDEAATYIKGLNQVALPHYTDDQWAAFARRTFREEPTGAPELNYDPDISAPIKAAGPDALVPDLWPLFAILAQRPLLLIRGAISDLLSADIADRMKAAAPDMAYAEVPGIGHAPMLDEPVSQDAILAFLESVP